MFTSRECPCHCHSLNSVVEEFKAHQTSPSEPWIFRIWIQVAGLLDFQILGWPGTHGTNGTNGPWHCGTVVTFVKRWESSGKSDQCWRISSHVGLGSCSPSAQAVEQEIQWFDEWFRINIFRILEGKKIFVHSSAFINIHPMARINGHRTVALCHCGTHRRWNSEWTSTCGWPLWPSSPWP